MSVVNSNLLLMHIIFMKHHEVFKESSLTTSLRVVIDASMASTSRVSVNNLQMIGAVIQSNLFLILFRFEPEQRSFQRLIWHDNATEALKT